MPARALTKTCALACYVLAQVGSLALFARVVLFGLDLWPTPFQLPSPWNLVLDLGWLTAFAVQHSLMARASFKRLWTRLVPPCLERSLYVGFSGALLLGLSLTWQEVNGPVLWDFPRWTLAISLAGWLGTTLVNGRFDHAAFFGLRQAWWPEKPASPEQLIVAGPYRYLRHPMMACMLVSLWAQPLMTSTLTLLDGGLTVSIFVGVILEERDLLWRFGPAYAAYRRRVPALVPWRRPAPPSLAPEVAR